MRIVFKVIAIIGVLSFLGGLKNGEIFIFGLILAGIFGYFGWRPLKKMNHKQSSAPINLSKKNTKTTSVKNRNSSNQHSNQSNFDKLKISKKVSQKNQKLTPTKKKTKHNYPRSSNTNSRSSSELTETSLLKKKKLLQESYEKGLLTKEEFIIKTDELSNEKKTSIKQTKSSIDKQIEELLLIQNKDLIDQLLKLLISGIIDQDEFNTKKTEILKNARIQYLKNLSKND